MSAVENLSGTGEMSPCQYCEERYPKCHSECQPYLKFKIKHGCKKYRIEQSRKETNRGLKNGKFAN